MSYFVDIFGKNIHMLGIFLDIYNIIYIFHLTSPTFSNSDENVVISYWALKNFSPSLPSSIPQSLM